MYENYIIGDIFFFPQGKQEGIEMYIIRFRKLIIEILFHDKIRRFVFFKNLWIFFFINDISIVVI